MLNKIIEEYKKNAIAITSIGLDGEKIDNVTFQEKPRIKVYPKMLVATAIDCLKESEIEYVIHEKTDISTPLGDIAIVEAISEGLVLVAGPSTNSQMKQIIILLKKYNPLKILIDGALFRKSIARSTLSDAIILSTGASFNRDIDLVIQDTQVLIDQLQIKPVNKNVRNYVNTLKNSAFISSDFNENIAFYESFLDNEIEIAKYLNKNYNYLFLDGALTDRILEVLIDNRHKFNKLNVIVKDATHILINPRVFHKLGKIGVELSVLNSIEIIFIAYNPYSPLGYSFDNNEFRSKLSEVTDIDIVNVLIDME